MIKHVRFPLLVSTEPDEYLVDTSAWLNIDSCPKREDTWALIFSLVREGRLFTCAQVIEELHDDGIYLLRLKEFEEALRSGDRTDVEYLLEVGKVTRNYPSMSGARGRKTPADPFVVALAKLQKYVVVADESTKRPNRKIPGVCKELGIKCRTLSEFIEVEVTTRMNEEREKQKGRLPSEGFNAPQS